MPSVKKAQEIEELTDRLSRSTVAIATGFGGVSGNTMMEFRRHLRSQGIEYRVVKNTLTERAAQAAGRPEVKSMLEGPTALAFGYGEPVNHLKAILDYVRTNRLSISVRAAALGGQVYRDQELAILITLPPREVLAAQLVGQLASPLVRLVTVLNQPIQGLANVLNGPLRGLASVLQQRIAQQGGA